MAAMTSFNAELRCRVVNAYVASSLHQQLRPPIPDLQCIPCCSCYYRSYAIYIFDIIAIRKERRVLT